MAKDTTNIKIGACEVTWGGVDLGHTKGGCTVVYTPEFAELMADQYGNTKIDKRLLGEEMRIRVPLTETQVANLKNAIPLATQAVVNERYTIGKDAGASLLDEALELVMHPLANGADLSDDVVIYKAVVDSEVEIAKTNEDQTIVEVEFMALIDTSKSDGAYLGHIGDSTAS